MNKKGWLEKYKFYILGILLMIIVSGWTFLYFQNNININSENNKEKKIINAKVNELEEKLNMLSNKSVTASENAGSSEKNNSEKININSADAEKLEQISGIGPSRARDIINYRETYGRFNSIEEIQNIKGIGPVTFEKMADTITIE